MRRGLIAVILVSCGSGSTPPSHDEPAPPPHETRDPAPPANDPPSQVPTIAAPVPPVSNDAPPQVAPQSCLPSGTTPVTLDLRAKDIRGCFDENEDDKADLCVRWRRDTGALIAVDRVFDVEAPVVVALPEIAFRTQDENDDDDRIEIVDNSAEICPPDRACMRIKPQLDGEELTAVASDPAYRTGVLAIQSSVSEGFRLEIWDLGTGRLRGRRTLPPAADTSPTLAMRMAGSSVIALVTAGDRTHGQLIGLDGSLRGAFAGGAHDLDVDDAIEVGGAFVVTDEPEDKPYTVYVTSLGSGQTLARFSIPHQSDLVLHTVGRFAVAVQDGDTQRFDLIDVRARTLRTLVVPGC